MYNFANLTGFRFLSGMVCIVAFTLPCSRIQAQATNTNPQSGNQQNMNNPFILINSDVPGGFLSATIVKDGDSFVEVTAPIDRPEIGKYKCVLERTSYDQCDRELLDVGFSGLESPKTLAPTVATITIGRGVGADPNSIQLKTFPLREIPSALNNFLKTSRKAIDQVRANRFRVIEAKATCKQASFLAKDPLAFQVQLTNVGIEKAVISSPIFGQANGTRVTLALTNVDDKSTTPKPLAMGRNEVVLESLPKAADAPAFGDKITLLADESILLKLSKSAYAKPGSYQAVITLHFVDTEPSDVAQVTGTLTLTTDKFTIQAN